MVARHRPNSPTRPRARSTKRPPSALLSDGAWCGHGEVRYWVYEVEGSRGYQILLPQGSSPPAVALRGPDGSSMYAYDSRAHPSSPFAGDDAQPQLAEPVPCNRCGALSFDVALGFAVPLDAQSDDDTSWFALAGRCRGCGFSDILYDDETA